MAELFQLGKQALTSKSKNGIQSAILHWTKASIEYNHSQSMQALGMMYLHGTFIAKNVPLAVSFLEGAAKQNEAASCYELGKLHFTGNESIEKDISKTEYYWKKAMDRKHQLACHDLAKLYGSGMLGKIDENVAFKCYLNAISNVDASSIRAENFYEIGKAYVLGKGVKADMKMGVINLEKAAATGHLNANFELGMLYLAGNDWVQVNRDRAAELLFLAAEGNIAEAQYYLATLLEQGSAQSGIPPNVERAIEYYKRSAENGFELAIAYVNKL